MLTFRSHDFVHMFFYCVCILFLSFTAHAQGSATVSPLVETVREALHPYLTHPDRRDPQERINMMDKRLEIWRLESFERGDINQKICTAVKSLIFGRLDASTGIGSLFEKLPSIEVVELVFYRVKTHVDPALNGQYQQTRNAMITARLSLNRDQAQMLDPTYVKQTLQGADCVSRARDVLENIWISDDTVERREKLRQAALDLRKVVKRPGLKPAAKPQK